MTSRRTFTKAAAFTALSYQRIPGANDRVRLGFIGVGNRGTSLVRATKEYADQQIAAVCDIRRDFMENAAQIAGTSPELFNDYRDVIAKARHRRRRHRYARSLARANGDRSLQRR